MVSALDRIIPNVNLRKWRRGKQHGVGLLVVSCLFSASLLALLYSASYRHRRVTHATQIGQLSDYGLQGGAIVLATCVLLMTSKNIDSPLFKLFVISSLLIIILCCFLISFDRDTKYTSVYRHGIGAPGGFACLTSTMTAILLLSVMDF